MIRFRILGGLDLRDHDGRDLRAILAQPRRLGLLAYIAMAGRHGFVRRDQTLAVFWPEHDSEHARAALNRAIYYLRHSLGDGVLISRGADEIALSADHLWCDAIALENAVQHGRYDEALDLYRGEPLAGFFVSNAPGFERWLDEERRRLGDLVSRTAATLADAAERSGDRALAVRWCQWAVDHSPLDEIGVQRLIGALDRAGDRSGAVVAYERFARRIAGELDVAPAPETQAIVVAIRQRGTATASPAAAPAMTSALVEPVDESGAANNGDPTRLLDPRRRFRTRATRLALAATIVTAIAAGTNVIVTTHSGPVDERRIAVVAASSGSSGDPVLDSLVDRGNAAIRDAIGRMGLVTVVDVAAPSGRASVATPVDLRRISQQTGAGSAVVTTIRRDHDTTFVDARIVETFGHRVRWVIPSARTATTSPEAGLGEMAQRVAGAVAALADRRFASWLPVAASPPTLAAYQELARGMELRLSNRPTEALPHFERASAADTTFTWALLEAATTHMTVGHRGGADSIVTLMQGMHDRLTPVERHWLDWMDALKDEDWTRSYAALEAAAQIAPERFLYLLAENARWLNLPHRSVELLERLGPESALGAGFGYWYLLADSYHTLGDHARELDIARRGRRRHPDRLTAVIVEARARAALGDVAGAIALADTVLSFPRGGRDTPGTMMLQTAEELRAHGHAAASAGLFDRAIAWFRAMPASEAALLSTRLQFAKATYDAGRWAEADSLFRELARDDQDGTADHEAMLGAIAAHRGDVAEATRFVAVLERRRLSLNRPREDAMFGQARIMAVLGNPQESLRLLREALGGQGQDLHTEADFATLVNDPAFRLFVKPKG
jgi:DNA-binding SARP family transcriptional activator/tetratricopeptide (TPR) repeat protein